MENNQLSIIRKVIEEGFGKGDLSVIDRYMSNDITEHQFGHKGGKEGVKMSIQDLHASFPDMRYSLQKYVQDGDIIWVHYKAAATHTGSFMGVPPSGKKIEIDVMDVARIQNGTIVEHWGIPDRFALLMQLGLLGKKEPVS
jgi:predicted ester cyclase